jgi:hypothetical protein
MVGRRSRRQEIAFSHCAFLGRCVSGRVVSFQITVLKVLAGHPEGRDSTAGWVDRPPPAQPANLRLTSGLPGVTAREPFPDLLPATSGCIDDRKAKCCTAVIAVRLFLEFA